MCNLLFLSNKKCCSWIFRVWALNSVSIVSNNELPMAETLVLFAIKFLIPSKNFRMNNCFQKKK